MLQNNCFEFVQSIIINLGTSTSISNLSRPFVRRVSANFDCRSSLEKLQETEERKNSELKYLRRCGIAVEIDLREKDKQPCLINLTADPMLSGTLLYLIPPGLVRIGKHSENSETFKKVPLDIILDGPLVRKLHWLVVDFQGRFLQQLRRSSSSLFEAS
ncbi:kinesin-like protein KIF14 [Vespula squamosa]|uniref:Kinesin-like protein KIF14 n=1 Tax=Vespula squamosa TaxID=30214 RepID=A0ABD2C1U0_VESSQ